jgi:hypothetical protein
VQQLSRVCLGEAGQALEAVTIICITNMNMNTNVNNNNKNTTIIIKSTINIITSKALEPAQALGRQCSSFLESALERQHRLWKL